MLKLVFVLCCLAVVVLGFSDSELKCYFDMVVILVKMMMLAKGHFIIHMLMILMALPMSAYLLK